MFVDTKNVGVWVDKSLFNSILFITFFCLFIYLYDWLIGQVGRVFTCGPGDLGSIRDCVIPKTLKMVRDTSLLTTQQ